MNLFEHLTKKYEFKENIYREMEMNDGYKRGCRHIFPYSQDCF